MPGFLEEFFPEVLQQVDDRGSGKAMHFRCRVDALLASNCSQVLKMLDHAAGFNPYCTYDNQALQWFTSRSVPA